MYIDKQLQRDTEQLKAIQSGAALYDATLFERYRERVDILKKINSVKPGDDALISCEDLTCVKSSYDLEKKYARERMG